MHYKFCTFSFYLSKGDKSVLLFTQSLGICIFTEVPIANTFTTSDRTHTYVPLLSPRRMLSLQKEKPCGFSSFVFFFFFLQLCSRALFCNVSSFRFEAQTEKPRWFLGRNATIWHRIFFFFLNTQVVSTHEQLSIHLPPGPLALFHTKPWAGSLLFCVEDATCSTRFSNPACIVRLTPS